MWSQRERDLVNATTDIFAMATNRISNDRDSNALLQLSNPDDLMRDGSSWKRRNAQITRLEFRTSVNSDFPNLCCFAKIGEVRIHRSAEFKSGDLRVAAFPA
jgi:hypothetical protein